MSGIDRQKPRPEVGLPLDALLADIRACTLCAKHLPLGPRPVVQAHPTARLLIVGQAPGCKVHATGLPFNDASGERLRAWMKKQSVSQEALAKSLDTQQAVVSRWLNGKQYPNLESAHALETLTGITTESWLQ